MRAVMPAASRALTEAPPSRSALSTLVFPLACAASIRGRESAEPSTRAPAASSSLMTSGLAHRLAAIESVVGPSSVDSLTLAPALRSTLTISALASDMAFVVSGGDQAAYVRAVH